MTTRPMPTLIHCTEHGTTPWVGDLYCGRCGIVYVHPQSGLGPVPDDCSCGAPLLPKHRGAPFSAVVCCHRCALEQAASQGGGPTN